MLQSRLWNSVQYHQQAKTDKKYSDGIRLLKSAIAGTPPPSRPE